MTETQGLDKEALGRMARVLEQPETSAAEAPAPAVASPFVAEEGVPDWLKPRVSAPMPAAYVDDELPEWLRPPTVSAPSVVEQPPAPVESEEERVARLGKEEVGRQKEIDSWFDYNEGVVSDSFLDREIEEHRAELQDGGGKMWSLTGLNVEIPLEEYVRRLEQIRDRRQRGGESAATPVAEPIKGMAPVPEVPPETAPAPVNFAARVEAARGLVEGASGKIKAWIKGELYVNEDRSSNIDRVTPDYADEEILAREQLVARRKESGELKEVWPEFLTEAEWSAREEDLTRQEQYLLGREMARDASRRYEEELTEIEKGLDKPWFGGEAGKRLVAEMEGLETFLSGFEDPARVEEDLIEARQTAEMVEHNFKKLALTEKQKRLAKENVTALESQLTALKSLDVNGLLARKDLPPQLRAVIEARRAGKPFDFGTGRVANFRRRVYESIIGTLGVEVAPAVEVVEAAAPAMAPTPEPEPAPAAAAAPVTQEPKPAAAPEKKVEPTAEPVAEKMKQPLSTFAKDLIAAREKKDQKAFARAAGETQERLVRSFADNPQGLRDELAGLPENEQKQLLAILLGAVKSGKADARLDKFARGLLGKKEALGVEVSAGALGIFGKIIEWITGMTVEQLQEQLKAK